VSDRILHLHVSDEELAQRRAAWVEPAPAMLTGWQRIYHNHVMQADQGADLDILVGRRGAARQSHASRIETPRTNGKPS